MTNNPYDGTPPPEPPLSPPPGGILPTRGPGRELSEDEIANLPVQALLVRTGMLTIDQLSDALRENVSTGKLVEDIAVARGWVPAEEVARLYAAKQAVAPGSVPASAPPPVAPAAPVAPVVQAAPPYEPAPQQYVPQAPAQPEPYLQAAAPPPPAPMPVAPQPLEARPPIVQTGENGASVGVFLNLADGERLWIGRFASVEDGERRAEEIIDLLMRPEPGVWPRFGNRLVRPGSVVAVEVSRRREE